MNHEVATTHFIVDKHLCIGCGKCVDVCPMNILEIADDICIMTKHFMCLECGTRMRECPEHAITIEGVGDREQTKIQEKRTAGTQKKNYTLPPCLKN